jgi:L-gulonate 3-dehydrogenase
VEVTTHSQNPNAVAVIGAGFIGCSYVAVFARAGWEVRIYDADPTFRSAAKERVASLLKQTGHGDNLKNVSVHDDLEQSLDGVRWVQECTPENLDIKQSVFIQLDKLCPSEVILASSASALTMTAIAEKVSMPGRCVVVHPTNPPHLLRFVEIVAGANTKPHVVTEAAEVMRAIGQYPAVLHKEIPGFILNRLQVALEREAFKLLACQVASVQDIDAAVSEGLGPRWAALGPFAVEETNAANIGVGLTKFRAYFNETMAELDDEPFDAVDDAFIALAVEGVRVAYGENCHDDLLEKRDNLLTGLKDMHQP